MINFQELEKVAEFKNGELNWLEGRDINAVYVILVDDEYYIGSSHYTYLRIGQHLNELQKGTHHSEKLQKKFDEIGEFEVYSLDRGIERNKLQLVEFKYIDKYHPTLNISQPFKSKSNLRIKEILKEKDITVNQLSEMLGVSRQALSKQIQGKMLVETAEKIAEALGVEMWELFASKSDIIEKDKDSITCPKCGTIFKMQPDD